ncbi:hypothetical protein ACMVVZ_000120 [Escherichia coli]|nr:hypothetical protein [Escherichia coli]MDM7494337.1 hypothetical protein [Escherichia coli]MEB6047243.1 hypothetical protein [Escherichia coli]
MTNNESTEKTSPSRKRRRSKIAHEHESERFSPCAFALEKFLKEYRKTRPLQVWKRNEPKG